MSKRNIINVGIDLGTSQSSISTSDGQRHMVESYVGWPADLVAKKVLRKKVLVGAEAVEHRTMVELSRPLEHGVIREGSKRDAEAVRVLLAHLLKVSGLDPESREEVKVRAVVGAPAESLRVNKQQLRSAMKGLVDSLMIVTEPFAVAYGLDSLLHSLIIDVGAGTTDFCVMKGRYPTEEDQRTLNIAGDSVDQQLLQLIGVRYPEALITVHMVRDWKEKFSFVGKPKSKVVVTAPVTGKPTDLDITSEMQAACESLIEPISETTLDLISKVEPEFQEKVRNNVTLSGGSGLIEGFDAAIQASMSEIGGGRVTRVKDPLYVGSDGGLALANDAPASDWEKLPA